MTCFIITVPAPAMFILESFSFSGPRGIIQPNMLSTRLFFTFGGSPRASINLAKASRAYAFIKHRGYVVPEDVRAVAHDVMRHRVGLSYEAEAANVTSEEIVSQIINKVEVP